MSPTSYEEWEKERAKYTEAILSSTSQKRVVVAGAGTGKTFLFQKILEQQGKSSLTLSFINALVDDLSLGLHGMSEVKTLHGFAASFLKNEPSIKARIFPKLSGVILEDAKILGLGDVNFEEVFQTLSGDAGKIEFYRKRKDYYGKYYGFSDAIYAVVKYLEINKSRIPKYDQLLIDEFQDFNEVEVALIELLAEKSPILIAGDDDQSLYSGLKNADPVHIRKRHGSERPEYDPFFLPYCSRCSQVIVEATNDLIEAAKSKGLFTDRVKKTYEYFPNEKKDKVSKKNPKVLYFQRMYTNLPGLIADELSKIAAQEREPFSVLVIMPPQIKKYSLPYIAKSLIKRGFKKIEYASSAFEKYPTLLDGLKELMEDKDSSLGWRIVAKHIMSEAEFVQLINQTNTKGAAPIQEILAVEHRKKVRELRSILNKIIKEEDIEEDTLTDFLKTIGHEPLTITKEKLQEDLASDSAARQGGVRAVRNIPITLTTIPSSKGLAADYVFLLYFDDAHFGGASPTEENVCGLLVALTRAKKRAYLVSTTDKIPTLLNWINTDKIEKDLMPDYTERRGKGKSKAK